MAEKTVIAIGTPVELGGGIAAWVTAVCLRGTGGAHVCYECRWWDGRDVKTEWFCADEVLGPDDAQPMKIGFGPH
jgi:uncharacterized protein YodC (DUF2158 family)